MKAIVDHSLCEGHAKCMDKVPEVLRLERTIVPIRCWTKFRRNCVPGSSVRSKCVHGQPLVWKSNFRERRQANLISCKIRASGYS